VESPPPPTPSGTPQRFWCGYAGSWLKKLRHEQCCASSAWCGEKNGCSDPPPPFCWHGSTLFVTCSRPSTAAHVFPSYAQVLLSHYLPWIAEQLSPTNLPKKNSQRSEDSPQSAPVPPPVEAALRAWYAVEMQLYEFALALHKRQLAHVQAIHPVPRLRRQ
jgi:hypothetical protein